MALNESDTNVLQLAVARALAAGEGAIPVRTQCVLAIDGGDAIISANQLSAYNGYLDDCKCEHTSIVSVALLDGILNPPEPEE